MTPTQQRYIQNLNDRRRMRGMYPHHPMQRWERVALAIFIALMFAGLVLMFQHTAIAQERAAAAEQEFLDFINRKFVLSDETGHTVYADTLEIGAKK